MLLRSLPSPKRRRVFFFVFAALLLGGVIVQSVYFPIHKPPPPLTVPVERGDMEVTVVANGTLQPQDLVSVGAQVTGQITALNVALGDRVTHGQLIAEIDSGPFDYALRGAQATLDNLIAQKHGQEAALVLARQTFGREKELIGLDSTSRADFDTAQATMDETAANIASLEAQIAGARINLSTAALNLSYTRISAPIDGTVVAVVTRQGQTVTSGFSTPTIVLIANLDTMIVKARISEADVARVAPGQKVYFTTLGDIDKKHWGTLHTIDPAPESFIDSATGKAANTTNPSIYYNGRFEVANSDGKLRPDMTVEVNVVLAEAANVLTVPSVALGPKAPSGKDTVKILDADGKEQTREITLGINNNVKAQVLDGLKEGDKVVAGTVPPAEGQK